MDGLAPELIVAFCYEPGIAAFDADVKGFLGSYERRCPFVSFGWFFVTAAA